MARGEVPFQDLVDPILPLDRVADGFDALHNGYRLGGKDVLKVAVRGGLA
jgi:Zn-dependent alcohol dehydrogenase